MDDLGVPLFQEPACSILFNSSLHGFFSRCIAGICCSCLWFFSGVPQEDDLLFDGAELDGFLVWLPLNVYIDDHRYGQKHRETWGKPFGTWSTYMVGFPHWLQRVSPWTLVGLFVGMQSSGPGKGLGQFSQVWWWLNWWIAVVNRHKPSPMTFQKWIVNINPTW